MLILALLFVGVLWLLTLGFARSSVEALRLSQSGISSERALWTAEAGLAQAVKSLLNDPKFKPSRTPVKMAQSPERYLVELYDAASAPVTIPPDTVYLLSTGYDRSGTTRRVAAVVRLGGGPSPFAYSIFASSLDLNGGSSIDSFDSSVGPRPLGQEAHVATNSVTPGAISLDGGSRIQGEIKVGPGGRTGEARPSQPTRNSQNVVWKNWSTWSLAESNLDQPLEYPPVEAPPAGNKDVDVNWKGADLQPGAYDELRASGGGNVVLRSGTYVFSSIKLTGGAKLSFEGTEPALIYVTDNLDMSNGTVYNTSLRPKNMVFMLGAGAQARLTGGAQAYLTVYGPEADISMSGGSDLYGALVADTVEITGGGRIHYDVDLARDPPKLPFTSGGGGGGVISWQRF